MDKKARKRIGILLVSSDIGVVYYLLSIMKSLNFLNDKEMPAILMLYDKSCKKFIELFKYKYLSIHEIEYNNNKKLKYLQSIFFRKNLFTKPIIKEYDLDGLFPLMDNPVKSAEDSCIIASWIPDLQHKFYPEFFSKVNLFLREQRFKKIIGNCNAVVLSSNDSYNHVKKYYKVREGEVRLQVMPFVSMIQDLSLTGNDELIKRYKITTPYFLVSNQFYTHKNHMVVLNAIKVLKERGLNFTVFLTGKTEDYRNPLYFGSLTRFIKDNDLNNEARIVGLIPREDQLALLKNSLAVIQPSKFEGWSTIIEDAKTLQKQVICSNISVHVEQMGEKAFYFRPDSVDELSNLMYQFISNKDVSKPIFINYEERVKIFGSTFVDIFR